MTTAFSILRIFATAAIFVYHFLGLYGLRNSPLDIVAIAAFMFLSGYFANLRMVSPASWLLRRYSKVLVPYWIVMVGVLAANSCTHYKTVDAPSLIASSLVGSLFFPHSVYVISWFITYILVVYGFCYLAMRLRSAPASLLLTALFFYLNATYMLKPAAYPLAFLAGLAAYRLSPKRPYRCVSSERWHRRLFLIQNHSYYFFLLHGGILLFFARVAHFGRTACFLTAFVLSCLASIPLKLLSDTITRRLPTGTAAP